MNNRYRIVVNVLAAGVTAVLGAPAAHALDVYLSAEAFTSAAAGGATMWGYANCNSDFSSCDDPSSPGPEITVPVGDTTLRIHLQNTLSEATSVMIPGQRKAMTPVTFEQAGRTRIRAFDVEAGPGDTLPTIQVYEWTDLAPGTYLYQSASHVQLQVQMGLYGAMTHDYKGGTIAYAYGVPVATAGFESPDAADGAEVSGANDWQATGLAGVFDPASDAILIPTDGQQAGWTSSGGELVLALGNVVANASYDVSVDIGKRFDREFAGYDVGLYAGATRVGGVNDTDPGATTPPDGGFQTWSAEVATGGLSTLVGEPLELRLASTVAIPSEVPLTVSGFSFEAPDATDGTEAITAAGWTLSGSGSGGVFDPPATGAVTPTQGDQVGWSSGQRVLAQVLGTTLQANTTYTLEVDVGDRADRDFAGYAVGLYAGGALLAQDTNTLTPSSGFLPSTVSYTTPPSVTVGQALEIRLASTQVPPTPTAIPILNASFESPNPNNGSSQTTATSWSQTGSTGVSGVLDPNSGTAMPSNAATSTTYDNSGGNNGPQVGFTNRTRDLRQSVGTIAANTIYTLRVWVGDSNSTAFHGYAVSLYTGSGALLGTQTGGTSAINNAWSQVSVAVGPFAPESVQVGQTLQIRLASNAGTNTSSTARTFFDDVTLEATTIDMRRTLFDNVRLRSLAIDQRRTMFDRVTVTRTDVRSEYNTSKIVVFSEVDPTLHNPTPKAANLTVDGYLPRYFLINGDGSPTDLVTVATGERVLLRLVNAGLQNRAPQLVGGTFEIVAEDGHATPVSHQQHNTLLPAGKALDLLFVAPAVTERTTFTLYDRRLGLSNGSGHLGHIVVTP